MLSKIVACGCAPTDTYPLTETVTRASNAELTDIYHFWQSQPDTMNVRLLAIGIIEREILERISLDASEVLTAEQQRRVMTFARGASERIAAFEHFYVVMGSETQSVWIIYSERQLARPYAHAILVDADGAVCGIIDGKLAERLGELPIVDIRTLFAEDGSDTPLLASFKPPLAIDATTP
jgi:hypothetical protein